jgi:hypothetical protein
MRRPIGGGVLVLAVLAAVTVPVAGARDAAGPGGAVVSLGEPPGNVPNYMFPLAPPQIRD